MRMKTPGALTESSNGIECSECGEEIEEGERCITANYSEIVENGRGGHRSRQASYAGIYHEDCF